MTQLLAGLGTLEVGPLFWEVSISQVEHQSTFRLVPLLSPSPSTSGNVADMAQKPLLTSPITRHMSFWAPCSFGLDGSVRLRNPTSFKRLFKLHFPSLLGFNGGSALAANLRAAQACIVTNLAASVGGITWMLWVCRDKPLVIYHPLILGSL